MAPEQPEQPKKSGRGGSRKHEPGCTCGNCPKLGRPKVTRPTNANVASKVLAQVKAEQLWLTMIEIERIRLGINKDGTLSVAEKEVLSEKDPKKPKGEPLITGPDHRGNFSIYPLFQLLRYLEDRAYGKPVEHNVSMSTVNHVHDKPLDVNLNISLSEKFRIAMEKAEKRVAAGRGK